jgi:hypothetical protein
MLPPLTLRAALSRGAVVTFANWQIVVVDFVVESAYKLALAVPVIGGAFMVAVLLGVDISALLGDGLPAAVEEMLLPLLNAPAALIGFVIAVSLVGVAGAVVMFTIKAGTLAVLVAGEAAAGEATHRPVSLDAIRRARVYSLDLVLKSVRRFDRRAAVLALGLGLAYVVLGGVYLTIVVDGFRWVAESAWAAAWPLLVFVATSGAAVAMAATNLCFDLARVIMLTDDCSVRTALQRVRAFLLADARQVLGVFGAMGLAVLLATALTFAATAGLALVAWAPIVGFLSVPLQIAFWIVRGLAFQYVSLTTLSAYQTQYRRFSAPDAAPVRLRIHEA